MEVEHERGLHPHLVVRILDHGAAQIVDAGVWNVGMTLPLDVFTG